MYRTRTRNTCANCARFNASLIAGILLIALCALSACEANRPVTNSPTASNSEGANAPPQTNSNQLSPEADSAASNVPITLPVVDALLSDEQFVAEVRRSVQPSDEQLDKLKNAARDAVLKLNEDGPGDDDRSTRTSVKDADQEIKQILGNDAGARFLNVARKYWSGGAASALAKPNEVPTDTRLVVNAPAYRMDLFRDGKLVKSYKVGIGYPEFPLPVGLRTAETIIFNPAWTPPDEPWVKGDFQPGKKVEPGSKKNPLGVLKIPIGLPSLIHGGKDPSRLGTFASHGCVGLTNDLVQEFAIQLADMSGTQLTEQDVKAHEKTRSETKEVNLARPIAVELRYETLVVEDGKLHIYRDVYERGTNTEENLNKVLEAYGVSFSGLTPEEQTAARDGLKKMAMDALGKPVDEDDSRVGKKPSKNDRVTRTIKGAKEVVVPIAALKGKGYPVPVAINS